MGARPPNAAERSRELGVDDYIPDLGLPPDVEWTSQGNLFHPEALTDRIAIGLLSWLTDPSPPRVELRFPSPARIQQIFASFLEPLRITGYRYVFSAWPDDDTLRWPNGLA